LQPSARTFYGRARVALEMRALRTPSLSTPAHLKCAVRWGPRPFPGGFVKPAREPEHLRTLLRRNAIERRVRQLGRQITADFRGQRLHLIGVLKGASIFLSDLIREIRLEVSLDFIAVASYGQSSRSSGQVRLTKDLDNSIEGLHTILVEDILDTGLTIAYLQ